MTWYAVTQSCGTSKIYNTNEDAPQDAHKLVLQVAEWLTVSLSGLARHDLTT